MLAGGMSAENIVEIPKRGWHSGRLEPIEKLMDKKNAGSPPAK